MSFICLTHISASTYHVSTTGNDNNSGTDISSAWKTIEKACKTLIAGDICYVHAGTYTPVGTPSTSNPGCIAIFTAGTADSRIKLWAAGDGKVTLDFSNINTEAVLNRGFYFGLKSAYWHLKGFEIKNAGDNGIKCEGSYHIFENLEIHDNRDTGLQIGMFKDWNQTPKPSDWPTGSPEFNPDYKYCRGNIVINCDSYNNRDSDEGDADGFATKLFPGPGTEYHGCRAWNNADDNWDLYMVYHPIIIENCWCWKGGYRPDGTASKGNGNGFKLGGGGSSGGAAFAQSVGVHVVKNCISFDNANKGYDQNNAQEGMYLFNNIGWNNLFNYRFPTVLDYGDMYIRNCIGFKPSTASQNHEFFSTSNPNTEYNSWTTLDNCDKFKDKAKGSAQTKDYTSEFKSLSVDLAKAPRQADGSLPENDFCKLKDNSVFIDKGQIISNFNATTHLPANKIPVGYVAFTGITIPYNGTTADFGAIESGDPTIATLALVSGNPTQTIYSGTQIEIIYKFGGAATDVNVTGVPAGYATKEGKIVTIKGNPTETFSFSISTTGGTNTATLNGTITVSNIAPASLVVTSGAAAQDVNIGSAMVTTIYTWGGGATDVTYTALPAGLTVDKNITNKTLTISGTPTADGTYTVTTVGGMEGSTKTINGSINRVIPTKVLTGDWYKIQDAFNALPADLSGRIAIGNGGAETIWDPAKTETGNPFSVGGIDISKSNGYVLFTLPSLVEFKINMLTTGDRTMQIKYGSPDQPESSWKTTSISSFSKGTFPGWDVMGKGGISSTKEPIAIKIINTASGGGLRIYDFYIKVYDDGSVGPEPIPNNELPVVQITSPESGTSFETPASITLTARASDPDGFITKVEFYRGSTLIGTVAGFTTLEGAIEKDYSFIWNDVAKGSYSITAKAYDDKNAYKISSAVSVTVTSSGAEPEITRLATFPYIVDFNATSSTFTANYSIPGFIDASTTETPYIAEYATYSGEGSALPNNSQAIRIEQNKSMIFKLANCTTFKFKWCSTGGRYPVLKDDKGKDYFNYTSNKTSKTAYTETATINSTGETDLTLSFNGSGGVTIFYLEINGQSSAIKSTSVDKGDIVGIKYYTITGVEVINPQHGVFIQKITYSNGAVETAKVMK